MNKPTQKVIKSLVLDGGVCSGKSTALARIERRLTDLGYRVFLVPETASILFDMRVTFRDRRLTLAQFQSFVLSHQIDRENLVKEAAIIADGNKCVIIHDRGVLDGRAYIAHAEFAKIAKSQGHTITSLANRYDAVFHLVTAADGAPHHYKREGHRNETLKQARALDLQTRNAWLGQDKLTVIDNSTDFEGKMRRLEAAVLMRLGYPKPLEIERKFVLKPFSLKVLPVVVEPVKIEQHYLYTGVGELRIRKRTRQDGVSTFYLTRKMPASSGRIEIERIISESEYLGRLSEERDRSHNPIIKTRYCFISNGLYFELDVFKGELRGLFLLEVELTNENQEVEIPVFLKPYLGAEVTGSKRYSNHELSRMSD